MMKSYTLASSSAKDNVDLIDYKEIIVIAVKEAMPKAKVSVYEDHYCVSPTPTHAQAVKIGKRICKSGLGGYCIKISKLFQGTEVKESEEDNGSKRHKKSMGGHF